MRPSSQERLIDAMKAIKILASEDLEDALIGRGLYSKLSKWINRKLAPLGENEVSDQSISNWMSGRLGVNGLDDSSARKLGLLLGFPRSMAGQFFKLYLNEEFPLPGICGPDGTLDQTMLKLKLILGLIEEVPESWLTVMREAVDRRLLELDKEGAMCLQRLLPIIQDLFFEDEFIYRIPTVSEAERQRYRDIYNGRASSLSDLEKQLITEVIERETGAPVEILDDCTDHVMQ